MTTAALLQATSVLTDTVVSAVWNAAGSPGGFFDASPTDTVATILHSDGVATPIFVTEFRAMPSVTLAAPGVGAAAFVGETIVTVVVGAALSVPGAGTLNFFTTTTSGFRAGDLIASGVGSASFKDGSTYPTPPTPTPIIKVRFITGPESGVIPVEIVNFSGPDVIEVRLMNAHDNFTPIFEDPTNPMRKKVHFN